MALQTIRSGLPSLTGSSIIALGVGAGMVLWVIEKFTIGHIFSWIISMPIHECGHALVLWSGGVPALPLPFLTATLGGHSFLVSALAMAVGIALCFIAKKIRSASLGCLAAAWTVLVFTSSFLFSERVFLQVVDGGGLGAEMLLSSFGLLLAGSPLAMRWLRETRRIFVAVVSGVSLVAASMMWITVLWDPSLIPMGGLLDFSILSSGESAGDLDKLIHVYGWTVGGIVSLYRYIMSISWLIVCGAYVAALALERRTAL